MFWVFGIIICFAEMGFRFELLKVFDHVLILLCSFTYVSVLVSLELCFSFAFLMTLSMIGLECVCILLALHL